MGDYLRYTKGCPTNHWARISCGGLIVTLILALVATTFVQAQVEIIVFRAEYQDDAVLIEWETGPEVDMQGFFITRASSQFGEYKKISNQIPHTGDETSGALYNYTDSLIAHDTTYWYRLEAVQENNLTTYSDRVQVVTGPAHTPTSTLTPALTNTPTRTTASSSGGAISTRTSTPTATLQVIRMTPTVARTTSISPTGTTTPEVTETISTTTTLIPLPEITLQFPTPVTNLDASSEGAAKPQGKSAEEQSKDILRGIGRAFFLGFIVLIWLVLGVWYYITSRRVE
jgi:hypothetical protein